MSTTSPQVSPRVRPFSVVGRIWRATNSGFAVMSSVVTMGAGTATAAGAAMAAEANARIDKNCMVTLELSEEDKISTET